LSQLERRCGGADAFANRIATVNLYRSDLNEWLSPPPMGTARSFHSAALMPNGQVLVVGGYSSAPPLIANLGGDGSAICGKNVGIASSGSATATTEIFDENVFSWTPATSMNSPRAELTLVRLQSGFILAAAGSGSQTAELYDPSANTWTYTGGMQATRLGAATALLPDGRVLVTGGNYGYNVIGIAINCPTGGEVYDPVANSWSNTGNMAKNRYHATATVVRVSDGTWRVLVVGGQDGNDDSLPVLGTAELWNPSTGQFTAAASMSTPRAYHTATLLPTGQVLVTGGSSTNDTTGVLNTAEVYDPLADTWTLMRNMNTPRTSQTATILPSPLGITKVFVVGGFDGTNFQNNAEVFQPTPIATTTSVFPTAVFPATANISSCQPGSIAASVVSKTGTGVPTGQVTFLDGSFPIGVGFLDSTGMAVFQPTLFAGTHVLQASYGADSAFQVSSSGLLIQQSVAPPIRVSGSSTAALGAPVQLAASVPFGAVAPFSFTWTLPNGAMIAGSNVTVTPPALGPNLYTVAGSDSNGCGLGGGSFTVNVYQPGVDLVSRINSLTRNGNIAAVLQITNQGADTALSVAVTASTFAATSTSNTVPMLLGTLPAGQSAIFQLNYPGSAAAPGTNTILRLSLTYTDLATGIGGNAGASFRVTAP